MKKSLVLAIVFSLTMGVAGLAAADLTVDAQFNLAGKDYANNFLTFKGGNGAITKDQFDATAGASKQKSTALFNAYRSDVLGKKTFPVALRYALLFSIANDDVRAGDDLTATKAADGTLTIRFVHRGSAFEIVTDKTGKVTVPAFVAKTRVIGHTDNTISTDFSASGKVADVDWTKVWNTSIADGKQVGSTTSKTGKVLEDKADSTIFQFSGFFQYTLNGTVLTVHAELDAKPVK